MRALSSKCRVIILLGLSVSFIVVSQRSLNYFSSDKFGSSYSKFSNENESMAYKSARATVNTSSTTTIPSSYSNDVKSTTTEAETTTETPSSWPVPPANLNVSNSCAYVYVIGGINPDDRRSSYHGYLYTIMANTFNMRETGSTADVVLWLQMSHTSANDTLPDADGAMLKLFDIKVRYIPKDPYESFVTITMEKFRILQMTEYKRVLFLDGDVVIRSSMDYLFWYSMAGVFEENVVFSGLLEPANAGTFMVTPHAGDWDQIQQIMVKTATRNAQLPYPHFDQELGWGIKIEAPDYYETAKRNGTLWDWHGVEFDQGLLYYWTKYVKKAVTYLVFSFARNWHGMEDGTVKLYREIDLRDLFAKQSSVVVRSSCWPGQQRISLTSCIPPHSDFHHLTGNQKPWLSAPPSPIPRRRDATHSRDFWWATLVELNDLHHWGINFTHWEHGQRPKLGLWGGRGALVARVQRLAAANSGTSAVAS